MRGRSKNIFWRVALLVFGLSAFSCNAAHPDLVLASPPQLSQAAWAEIQSNQPVPGDVALSARITAAKGKIQTVSVIESEKFPRTSVEG